MNFESDLMKVLLLENFDYIPKVDEHYRYFPWYKYRIYFSRTRVKTRPDRNNVLSYYSQSTLVSTSPT